MFTQPNHSAVVLMRVVKGRDPSARVLGGAGFCVGLISWTAMNEPRAPVSGAPAKLHDGPDRSALHPA